MLLVEDDAAIRVAVRRHLASHGYAVQEAAGVVAARKIYRARRAVVAILDYALPDGDGLQALRELRCGRSTAARPSSSSPATRPSTSPCRR